MIESRMDSPNAPNVRYIPLTYNHHDSNASATRLLEALLPEWKQSEGKIEFIKFTDGITNTLLKAVKRRPGASEHDLDRDAILLRAYGEGTDVLIDRERETKAHSLLASRDLAPPLLARFDNGLLYKFIEGDVCTPEDLRKPHVYRPVAAMLGRWHGSLPISVISQYKDLEAPGTNGHSVDKQEPVPSLWTVMQQWIDALPKTTEQERQRKRHLQEEVVSLLAKFKNSPGLHGKDYVFSHCDLLSGNVIVARPKANRGQCTKHTDHQVSFIDYEYATPAPAAFDIANHFAEWAGFECDYKAVPTKSQRRDFLTQYVCAFRAESNASGAQPETDMAQDLQTLYDQVDMYRGVPGFYWGIWALIQATISQIDFDYASYAEERLGEYWNWKAEDDGSRQKEGKEMSVREKRWAEE